MQAVISAEKTQAARVAGLEEHLILPGHEFADSDLIVGRVVGILGFCLDVVADGTTALSADGMPELARERFLLHPVARLEVQDAFDALCRGERPLARGRRELLRTCARSVARQTGDHLPPFWGPPTTGPVAARLAAQIAEVLQATADGGTGGHPVGVDRHEVLDAAGALLNRTVPALWGSARRHVQLAVLVAEAPFASGSQRRLPGTVLLSTDLLRDPALVAEGLLHEALHHKLYALYLQGPVLPPGYDAGASPRLQPPWHRTPSPGAGWPVDNVLAAMHVYLHLAVLRARWGRESYLDVGPPYASALSRAVYLAAALRTELAGLLGDKGTDLVEWLWDGLCRYAGTPGRQG